jgi:VIT1/CCC1 family predicted Fe2+/Mn2+ transporter
MHFNLDPDDINSPWQAAGASLVAFTLGGLVPFLVIVLSPEAYRIGATVIAVLIALVLTGYLSATAGNASRKRAVIRVVIGGLLAMIITYYVGVIFGSTIR